MKHRDKTKETALSAADWIEILLLAAGWFGLDLFFQHRLRNILPAAFSGPEGLRQVRHYLIMWLVTRYLRILLPGLLFLLTGSIRRICCKKKAKPSALRLIAAGILIISCALASLQQRNHFDLQCKQNGYRGTVGIRAAALISDLTKDMHVAAITPVMHPVRTVVQDFSYRTYGRRSNQRKTVHISEYALCDTDTGAVIAQISQAEYDRIREGNPDFFQRRIAVYPHSGLIAAADGTDGTAALESCETMFTLSYDAETQTLLRTDVPDWEKLRNLTMVIMRDGQIAYEIDALHSSDYGLYHPDAGLSIYLQARINGKIYRVSNELTF
jgi:hypothetical protein